jgi:hypothetical protein
MRKSTSWWLSFFKKVKPMESNQLLANISKIQLWLASNSEKRDSKKIISLDKFECIELSVFDDEHLLISAYEYTETESGLLMILKGFRYANNCAENVMDHAIRHYSGIIAERNQNRLHRFMPEELQYEA